jgi:signal transduction histidine kinase
MMKRVLIALALIGAFLAWNRDLHSRQDENVERARQEAASAAAAAEAARRTELRDLANDKARENFLNGVRQQSNAALSAAEGRAREAKRKENETKFAALERDAKELMDLSAKTYNQISSSGAQSVSLTVYSDLERIEKLVKEMRKNLQ